MGLYGDQRKLLVIIRNYRAALKKQNKTNKQTKTKQKTLGSYIQNKTTTKKNSKYQTSNGTDSLVTYTYSIVD